MPNRPMSNNYIFASPGFWRGAAQAVDFGGSLGQSAFVTSPTGVEADARALASDFRVVSADLHDAYAQFEDSRDESTPACGAER
jgi:hypothetical protein